MSHLAKVCQEETSTLRAAQFQIISTINFAHSASSRQADNPVALGEHRPRHKASVIKRVIGFCAKPIGSLECFRLREERSFMFARRALFVVSLVILMAMSTLSTPKKMPRFVTGTWGGQHIRMHVSQRSASVEFDCANGAITVPLTLNRKGEFSWRGFFSRERGGPVRTDEKPNREPALYTGSISGNTMTLTIKLMDSNEDLGTFTLKHGSAGRVLKCL
jgi:hypothetical protein